MKKLFLILGFFIVAFSVGYSQKPTNQLLNIISKDPNHFKSFTIAQTHFEEGNFNDALDEFLNLQAEHPEIIYYDYMVGINYVLVGENYSEAIELLEKTKKTEPDYEDLDYYLAKAYQLNEDYIHAIKTFNEYLKTNPSKNKQVKTIRSIEECENAIKNQTINKQVKIENLGEPVNTPASEYVPLISADETILIFTYRGEKSKGGKQDELLNPAPFGHYYEDIFITNKINEKWTPPQSISDNINTNGHDACVGLSADGKRLFIYKSDAKNGGDLYESFFDGTNWSEPSNLGPPINTNYWEGSCSLSADGKTLYFSSDRPGGFGGKDLYKSVLLENGRWSTPINLGSTINTKYDEDSPFIHPDNETFFFSSKGFNSIGGYDIYQSFIYQNQFSVPENLGRPINTPGDDIFYTVSASGLTGYYSSGREGGLGLQDIYKITPGITSKLPVIVIIKGLTTNNKKVVASTIKVTDLTNNQLYQTYTTNAIDGKFLLSLKPNNEYEINISSANTPTITQVVNLKSVNKYVEAAVEIDLAQTNQPNDIIQSAINNQTNNAESLTINATNGNKNQLLDKQQQQQVFMLSPMYKDLQNNYGARTFENTAFTIELNNTAINDPETKNQLSKLPGYTEIKEPNGEFRYFIGEFTTLNEADEYRKKIINELPIINNSFIAVKQNQQTLSLKEFFTDEFKKDITSNKNQTNYRVSNQSNNQQFEELQQNQLNYMSSTSYEQLLTQYGSYSKPNVGFVVEVITNQNREAAEYKALNSFENPNEILDEKRQIHHTTKQFSTLQEANEYRKKLVSENPDLANSYVAVIDNNKLRTVKDYFKEIMLYQIGFQVPDDVNKNNLQIIYINHTPINQNDSLLNIKAANTNKPNETEKISNSNQASQITTDSASISSNKKIELQEKQTQETIQFDNTTQHLKKEDERITENIANLDTITDKAPTNKPLENKNEDAKNIISQNKPTTKDLQKNNKDLSSQTADNPLLLSYYLDKDLNNPKFYNLLIEHFGEVKKEGLIFKVQIGAYRFPQNFKYKIVEHLGEVTATPYADGITRFTQLEHTTLKEAEAFRKTVIAAGIKDAWITVFYNGKRLLIQEAIAQNLLDKNSLNE